MLVGTADVETLAQGAPTIAEFTSDASTMTGVVCFQLTAEMHNQAREPVLPPALHPTVPPMLSIQIWEVGDSPFGAFKMALVRVSCRSGVRARGLTTRAYVSSETALSGLRSTFGIPAQAGVVSFSHNYVGAGISVVADERTILEISGLDPEPLGPDDVQYTGTLNLAHTPLGLRLVQLETHHTASRVERLQSKLLRFEPTAWGNPLLDPYRVVSSSLAMETVEIPAIRFVCKPDELAFTGTEPVRG